MFCTFAPENTLGGQHSSTRSCLALPFVSLTIKPYSFVGALQLAMSQHNFQCNGYSITPFGVRPISANHFTAFGKFSKDNKSVTISYPGVFATEELARQEVQALAPADALAAPSQKIPF